MRTLILFLSLGLAVSANAQTEPPKPPVVDQKVPAKIENPTEKLEPSDERQPKPKIDPAVTPEPEVSNSPNPVKETVDKAKAILNQTRDWRAARKWSAIGSYSFFDLIIPSKIGATAAYNDGPDKTYELEYLRGSLSVPFLVDDLGGMTDQRLTLMKRSYFGANSFNLSYGLSHMMFDIDLGSEILSRVSGGAAGLYDVISIHSLGLHVGIGNRWIFNERFVFGIDWLTWTQPIFITKRESEILSYADESDYENIDDAIRWAAYFPRLAALKLQFGMTF